MDEPHGVTIAWAPPGAPAASLACRSCGAAGLKTALLTARARLAGQAPMQVRLLDCPVCGCAFAEAAAGYDYTTGGQGQGSSDALSTALYVEAGAGLWPIVRTLARLRLPEGAAYTEVGCGFGFGLDFAVRARGWRGRGIDPSPLAAAGRALLGLPIESRFFGEGAQDDAALQGGADCIMASEVLEHVEDPRGFLAGLVRGLAPAGLLVLTTPDRAMLRPDVPMAELVPIVSAGAHLTLQTQRGLRGRLADAGLGYAEVTADGAQLVAYASRVPFSLERDETALRRAYRGYLGERAESSAPGARSERHASGARAESFAPGVRAENLAAGSSLWWGFASRAYQEAVADDDAPAAAAALAALQPACRARYGFDLDDNAVVPGLLAAVAGQPDLQALATRVPLALPGLLYARALDRLHGGDSLTGVAGLLRQAAEAAAVLVACLLPLGAGDLAAVQVERAATAALAGLHADQAAPDAPDALARAVAADPGAAVALARRSFVGLVNAGALAQAAVVRARWNLDEAALQQPDGSAAARDTVFCLGMLALGTPGEEEAAIARFAVARQGAAPSALWWAALRGECVAADRLGRHAHATALLREAPLDGMPEDLRARLGE